MCPIPACLHHCFPNTRFSPNFPIVMLITPYCYGLSSPTKGYLYVCGHTLRTTSSSPFSFLGGGTQNPESSSHHEWIRTDNSPHSPNLKLPDLGSPPSHFIELLVSIAWFDYFSLSENGRVKSATPGLPRIK